MENQVKDEIESMASDIAMRWSKSTRWSDWKKLAKADGADPYAQLTNWLNTSGWWARLDVADVHACLSIEDDHHEALDELAELYHDWVDMWTR